MASTDPSDLYQIEQRIIELYCLCERFFLRRFRRPYIRLDLRGETAGQAWPDKPLLRFNPVLLKENRDHFLQQTVAHEVAHLIAYEQYGRKIRAHGREWQSIMMGVFSLPADRCHTYDTGRSSRKSWLYRCQCAGKTIALSTVRHNRSQKGTVYLCTTCRGPLTFLKQAES